MIDVKLTEDEYDFMRSYQVMSKKHQAILEGLAQWFEVLEAIEMEGKEVDRATIRVEHDLFKVRFKHIWKLKDEEE